MVKLQLHLILILQLFLGTIPFDLNVHCIDGIIMWYTLLIVLICFRNKYIHCSYHMFFLYVGSYEFFWTCTIFSNFPLERLLFLGKKLNYNFLYTYAEEVNLFMCILYTIYVLFISYRMSKYVEYFKWLLYWQLFPRIRDINKFYVSLNLVLKALDRRFSIVEAWNFRLKYYNQHIIMLILIICYKSVCVIIKANNKLNILKKYFFKNFILFKNRKKFLLRKKSVKIHFFKKIINFFLKKKQFLLNLFSALQVNNFLLTPTLLSSESQIYYFLIFYISLQSVNLLLNIFIIYYNLFFFYNIYMYLYNFIIKFRWLKKKNFLFMLNLFLLFFFKKAWFFLKFIKSIFWKKKKDNIKKIIYFIRSFFKKFYFFFFKIFQVAGLLFFFKGKIGSYGNSRKKILRLNFGLLNSTTFLNNLIKSHCSFINKSGKTKCSLSLFF